MNVRCEFKLKEKIDILGMDLTDDNLRSIKRQLINCIDTNDVELNCVEAYGPEDEDPNEEPEDLAQIDGTFFDINIDLEQFQIENWKENKSIIFEKTINQLKSDNLFISSLWGRDNQQHIGFIKDHL